ncbi:MAG: hypothetical protein DI531_03190 [Brevundimonas sp.]|nr:MAG: hypothetical protein DI531_03190 [Brevundimonas sp.]
MRKKVTAYVGGLEVANQPLEIGIFDPRDDSAAIEWAKRKIEPYLSDRERAEATYRVEEY